MQPFEETVALSLIAYRETMGSQHVQAKILVHASA
jgi:hypothetical protein